MLKVILVTGATGSIGKSLVAQLRGHEVRVLARDPIAAEKALPGVRAHRWRIGEPVPAEAAQGVDVVVHLAGVPIADGRLTVARLAEVKSSRVDGTRAVVDAVQTYGIPALVCASAVGIYAADATRELTEGAPHDDSPLSDICEAWEAEAVRAQTFGARVVRVRVGIVLDAHAGALGKVLPLFRLGLGGKLGSGAQWMPWIHVADVAGLFAFAALHNTLRGVLNASAPIPVTNAEYTQSLAMAVGRPAFFTVPTFALRLALGELGRLAVMSQRMVPSHALQEGYKFQFPVISGALNNLVGQA